MEIKGSIIKSFPLTITCIIRILNINHAKSHKCRRRSLAKEKMDQTPWSSCLPGKKIHDFYLIDDLSANMKVRIDWSRVSRRTLALLLQQYCYEHNNG